MVEQSNAGSYLVTPKERGWVQEQSPSGDQGAKDILVSSNKKEIFINPISSTRTILQSFEVLCCVFVRVLNLVELTGIRD